MLPNVSECKLNLSMQKIFFQYPLSVTLFRNAISLTIANFRAELSYITYLISFYLLYCLPEIGDQMINTRYDTVRIGYHTHIIPNTQKKLGTDVCVKPMLWAIMRTNLSYKT